MVKRTAARGRELQLVLAGCGAMLDCKVTPYRRK